MKKIIGFAIVLAMVFAMLPFAAFAADSYYVAGESALCGSNWSANDTNNIMTLDGDVYKKVYSNVPVGNYQFKITDGTWDNNWGDNGGNYGFSNKIKADVTITFNATTKEITVTGAGVGAVVFEANSITAVGAGAGGFLNNESWKPAASSNHMTKNGAVWTISYPSVAAATYEFKFAANDAWSDSWGTGGAVTSGEWVDAHYNGSNSTVTVDTDGSTVELVLDLSAFDYGTKSGAKMKVTVTAPGGGEDEEITGTELVSVTDEAVGAEDPWTFTFNAESTGTLTVAMGACNPSWRYKLYYPDGSSTLNKREANTDAVCEYEIATTGEYMVEVYAYDAPGWSTVDGTISCTLTFAASDVGGGVDVEEYLISDTKLALGENALSMEANAENTLFEFEPEETGVYSFTAPTGRLIGDWNTATFPFDKTGSGKTNVVEWECTSVGQSVLIGIAGSEDVVLNVEKKGNAGSQETVEYVDYVNKHTPDSSNHLVLGEGEELVPVDISVPQTAVLGSDGFYHLGTADGPILYMDLIGAGVDMAGFYYSGMPAIHLRGQLFDADGNRIAAYNFLNSFKAYIDDSDDNGIYPMTEDLAIFMKAYGGVNGWFNPMFSPFAAVQDGCDADSAWLVACSYVPSGEVTPPVSEDINIVFHYTREDGNYDNWNLWAWDESGVVTLEPPFNLTVGTDEATATVTVKTGTQLVGYIFRLGDWEAKDCDYNQFIDVSNVVSGTIHVYITAGVATQPDAATIPTLDELIEDGVVVLGDDVVRGTEPPAPGPTLSDYIVAGSSGLCGSEWNPADDNNRMIDNDDGTFTITYNDIAAGTYEFKITKGSWNENWGVGGPDGDNVSVTLDSAGSVTIIFNPTTGEIIVNDQQTVPPANTGDVSVDGVFFAMILAAMGIVAVVGCKKKFF